MVPCSAGGVRLLAYDVTVDCMTPNVTPCSRLMGRTIQALNAIVYRKNLEGTSLVVTGVHLLQGQIEP